MDVIRKDEIGANIPLAQYALKVATSRPQMIDNVKQYSFIYTVLSEWVRSGGETSIPLTKLPEVVQELQKPPRSGYGTGNCTSKYEAELMVRMLMQEFIESWRFKNYAYACKLNHHSSFLEFTLNEL